MALEIGERHSLDDRGYDSMGTSTHDEPLSNMHEHVQAPRNFNLDFLVERTSNSSDLSRRYTAGIFGWMQNNGICTSKRSLFEHPWFLTDDESDEEDEAENEAGSETGNSGGTDIQKCEKWMSKVAEEQN